MKKIFIFLLITVGFLLLGFSVNAEEIRSFNSDIKINKDGTINVREIITYDFGYKTLEKNLSKVS